MLIQITNLINFIKVQNHLIHVDLINLLRCRFKIQSVTFILNSLYVLYYEKKGPFPYKQFSVKIYTKNIWWLRRKSTYDKDNCIWNTYIINSYTQSYLKDYTVVSVWSKITLVRGCIQGTEAVSLISKKGCFISCFYLALT